MVGGRFVARFAAKDYGRKIALSLKAVGPSAFADTKKMREFLDSPEMVAPQKRVQRLAFLGSGYAERIEELQRGIIYLSEQMALPPERRFSDPPQLKYLSSTMADRSDAGVATAAASLVFSYQTSF